MNAHLLGIPDCRVGGTVRRSIRGRCPFAADALAQYSDDDAAMAMGWLLLDRENVGVTRRAAEALIARNDPYGAALVFAGLTLCDAQRGEYILWALKAAWESEGLAMEDHAKAVLAGDSPWARFGAREALEWLHLRLDDGSH